MIASSPLYQQNIHSYSPSKHHETKNTTLMNYISIALTITFLSISSNLIAPQSAQAFTLDDLRNFFESIQNHTKHIQQDIIKPSQGQA